MLEFIGNPDTVGIMGVTGVVGVTGTIPVTGTVQPVGAVGVTGGVGVSGVVGITGPDAAMFNAATPTGVTGAAMPLQVDMSGNLYVKSGIRYARPVVPSPTGVALSTRPCDAVIVSLDGTVVQGQLADDAGYTYSTAPLAAGLEHPYEFYSIYTLIPSCICHALWMRKP